MEAGSAGRYEPEYVAGVLTPYLLGMEFEGPAPQLPLIDLAFTKQGALAGHLWGLLCEGWTHDPGIDGVSVFWQAYENRGPANERKRIYMSATTPDLIESAYRPKLRGFLARVLSRANAGRPLLRSYLDGYDDLYWDLHVGATGGQIPPEVRSATAAIATVTGFGDPARDVVHEAYLRARALHRPLRDWLDARIQAIIDGRVPGAESTFVHHWLRNGELGENFTQADLAFECLHNFLAVSQWGNMLYRVAAKLESAGGDPRVRESLRDTMTGDEGDGDGPFTPLDRLVMELYRVICPNPGAVSMLHSRRPSAAEGHSAIVTPHLPANLDPRHWHNPEDFQPERFSTVPTSADAAPGNAWLRPPFERKSFTVKDGRRVKLVNSAFGSVYGEIDGVAHPVCESAGYASFGFGYRRCPAEQLSVEFVKELLRKVWADSISFVRLETATPEKIPIAPGVLLDDDLSFTHRGADGGGGSVSTSGG